MKEWIRKRFKVELARDDNYYFGLILLEIGIVSIVFYLIFDAFEPLSFLITFLLCGWGFVLLWKSDNDYRFQLVQEKIAELETELRYTQLYVVPSHLPRRYKRNSRV
jgi:hypothetical protein